MVKGFAVRATFPLNGKGRMTISVVLADDQPLVRAGFQLILEAEDELDVVGEAGDGAEAVAAAERLQPQVVLINAQMPKLDGLEATRRIATDARLGASPPTLRSSPLVD